MFKTPEGMTDVGTHAVPERVEKKTVTSSTTTKGVGEVTVYVICSVYQLKSSENIA